MQASMADISESPVEPTVTCTGAQLCVVRGGEAILDEGFGIVNSDTISLWMSAVKPITAIAFAQLWEQGKLYPDMHVADVLPEFAAAGKESVTFRHILTHTAGFRAPHVSWKPQDNEELLERIYAQKLEPRWVPGMKAGYHVDSSWYVLAEAIRAVDGRAINDYVREMIFAPLDMPDCGIGLTPAEQTRLKPRLGGMVELKENTLKPKTVFSDPAIVALVRPGGNGRGPMNQLAKVYQALLDGLQGRQTGQGILQPTTVAAMTAAHRVGMFDNTFKHIIDWGLGFILNSRRYGEAPPYGYGDYASDRSFGHSGNQCCVAFADPTHELVVALQWNGMPGEQKHQARARETVDAIYQDLGVEPVPRS